MNAEEFAASLGLSVADTYAPSARPEEAVDSDSAEGGDDEGEEEVAPPSPPKKKSAANATTATRKRARGKKSDPAKAAAAKPKAVGLGVNIIGSRFVCSYSGRVVDRAVFIPGVDTACFANIPCAFAWIAEESNVPEDTKQELRVATAAEYEQTLEIIERAPERTQLVDFGGNKYYKEWIGMLEFWDRLTEASGSTVQEYKQRDNGAATKRGGRGGQAARVVFDASAYTIAYNKGGAGCKKVNTIDGVATEKGAKNVLTIVKAYRKLQTFINGHVSAEDEARQLYQVRQLSSTAGWYASVIVPCENVIPERKLLNNIATQLVGFEVFGPAVVVFTRKHTQKI